MLTLHQDADGTRTNEEDDKLNVALGEFMSRADIVDWEGANEGISVWLHILPGDVMLVYPDRSLRVVRRANVETSKV